MLDAEYSIETFNVVCYPENKHSCFFCKNGTYLPSKGQQILEKFNRL